MSSINFFARNRFVRPDPSKSFDTIIDQTPKSGKKNEFPPALPWNGGPSGIIERQVEPGLWPFRIYEEAGIDPKDNKALNEQTAATPELDPKAFGNRSSASKEADKALEQGDDVFVLSPERLDLLEKQRTALGTASDKAKSETDRDKAKDDLVVAIAEEVDLASKSLGTPKFGTDKNNDKKLDVSEVSDLIRPIAERAPDDPIFMEALNQVRDMKEKEWKADGKTDDQLGRIASLGDKKDYDAVARETKDQLIDVARAAGSEEGAQVTALTNRASIYAGYTAGDPEKYGAALKSGIKDALQEVRVDRHVRDLESAYGKGGVEGAEKFLAKLSEKTDRAHALPSFDTSGKASGDIKKLLDQSSGSLIASDPRVRKMIDQSIDSFAASGLDGDTKAKIKAVQDLAVASQNILYGDGKRAGAGKEIVDHIANRLVDKMNTDLPGSSINVLSHQRIFDILSSEDAKGSGTTLLTAIAARTADLGSAKSDDLKGKGELGYNEYLEQNSDAQWAVRRSIENFGNVSKAQDEKITTAYNELYHGLSGWNGVKRDEPVSGATQLARDMEAIDNLSPENKQKSKDLAKDGEVRQQLWEQQESIDLALKIYETPLNKVDGLNTEAPIPSLFGTGIMMTKSKSISEAMKGLPDMPKNEGPDPYANVEKGADPAATGTIWVERSARALATFAVTETLKGRVGDIHTALAENRIQSAFANGGAGLSKAEQDAVTKYIEGKGDDKNPDLKKYVKDVAEKIGEGRLKDIVAGRIQATDAERTQIQQMERLNVGTNVINRVSGGGSAILFGRNLDALGTTGDDMVYYVPHTMMMMTAAKTALMPNARKIILGKGPDVPTTAEARIDAIKERVNSSGLSSSQKKVWSGALNSGHFLRGTGIDALYVGADLSNAIMQGTGWIVGDKADGVKATGYGIATVSDAMFAAAGGAGALEAKAANNGLVRLMNRLGPLKISGVAAVLQLAGAGIVQGRSAYNASHTYDKADADAIQVMFGVKDRKVAEGLAEHNDLLDEGVMGILQTVFPGDEHLMGGDKGTRSADAVLTGTYGAEGYTRARLGQLFNRLTPEQATELSETIRDMTADGKGKLPATQDDLKYLQLPVDPAKVDLSDYPTVTYNAERKRYEDSVTTMYWDGSQWWMPQKKVTAEDAMLPSDDPLWYQPSDGTLMHENAFASYVEPRSTEGLKAWLRRKGYL
ncbi:hypothetical protein C9413_13605 [Rhizobium sp. SEMIA 4085]|uniref:Uncharacterized protein n=1 Tax=Rhizobium gallicum bv. gallicum R602sp TaxID=1041138 RepID=A0A0B4XG79_9HYPH|nr:MULTISPECIES: hypothetical protein [Rhizobium]AJD46081.1 hypothetical protein RGR602_PC02058 [Rhizobium gallicum bv. gallicum R602sp]NNH30502.1 hypothetical protein [Rhizobium sp. SEMIA 4085]